ncbi:hypothetical protein HZS_8181 [Henneguya salminicola]|nr:hypothetical protein HZS_8181 [Henneguya salminicola]
MVRRCENCLALNTISPNLQPKLYRQLGLVSSRILGWRIFPVKSRHESTLGANEMVNRRYQLHSNV